MVLIGPQGKVVWNEMYIQTKFKSSCNKNGNHIDLHNRSTHLDSGRVAIPQLRIHKNCRISDETSLFTVKMMAVFWAVGGRRALVLLLMY